ncbi:MAG: tssM [Betaproteobacteria bacterium]|jgi:type VI secretion system protein ImpL|nr:tssM [Betaproteobacteria bacterium]
MSLLRKIFSRRVLVILGIIALSLIIWFVGPLIAIASFRPLDPVWVRVVLIAALVLYFVVRWAWKLIKAKRADAQLRKSLVEQNEAAKPAEPAGAKEVALLSQRFEEAIAVLKETKQKKSGKLAVFGGHFLYDLPWYMFIGAPGSGKTTALVNSGLQFPLAERLGYEGVAGIGGTRNCDWWFTDEAVLIDTAGRYTTHESDKDADKAAWTGFLKLLAKYRPRRPINGALVTVSVADLLQQIPEQVDAHANAIRHRVEELHEQLNVRFPVYVIVSKADLLPGFMEFFSEYGREEREQVWGTTFPVQEKDGKALPDFNERFSALEKRLNERLFDRLQQERDPQKRALLYAFPQHFGALKGPLSEFLSKVFAPSRFGTQALVRGVYFTSGTQEGSPIDRIMGAFARALRLERKMVAPQRPSGKSFFITRLFKDIIFAEVGLAGTNLRWERRRGVLQWGALALTSIVTVGLLVAWGISYSRNRAYVDEVDAKLKGVSEQVTALGTRRSSDLVEIMPALRAVRDVASSDAIPGGVVPLSMQFGLYQGEKLSAAADAAYRGMLQNVFLPRVSMRIEQQLRSSGQQNLDLLYEALKAYIMLIEPKRFDEGALKAFLTAEWESSLPRDVTVEQRKELETHLDRLLALGGVSLPVQPDKQLIASARDAISRTPIAQRIYNRLKHQGTGSDLPEFTVVKASTASAPLVFTRASGQPLTKGVPGFFSFDGYHRVFTKAAGQVTSQLADEEPWVLGLDQSVQSRLNAPMFAKERLINDVRRLYLEDYVRVWDAFIRDVRLVRATDLQQSIALARALSAPDSPLPALLRAMAKEVTLVKTDEVQRADKSTVDAATEAIRKKRDDLMRMFGPGEQRAASGAAARPESIVDDHFTDLRRMVRSGGPGQPAPIDATTGLINDIYTQLVATQAAVNSGSPPPPSELPNKVKAEAARMPEPVQSMLTSLSQSATKQVLDQTRDNLSQNMATTVEDFCRKAIDGRYPFTKGSTMDVTQDDFTKLFAPGGLLDEFFQKNLAAHVDTTANPWRFRKVGEASMGEDSKSLAQFQRAHSISEAFFKSGKPSIGLQFKPVALDPAFAQLTLDVDGQIVKAGPGLQPPGTVQWPGPKGTNQVRLQGTWTAGGSSTEKLWEGPWAILRMFDRAQVQSTNQPEKLLVTYNVDGRKAQFEVLSASVQNPLRLSDLEQFRCPGKL